MSAPTARLALTLGLCVTSMAATGCGLVLDAAYLVSNRRYEESVQERKPTGQVHTAVEYDAALAADGHVQLTCEERERSIERSTSVTKTFERRGSFEPTTYVGTAVLSGVVAGTITAVMAALCTQPPADPAGDQLSCLNMIYAAPFALDVGWSAIRAATAKPAKLVEKRASEPVLAFSEKPTRTAPLPCDSVQVLLGEIVGYSEPTDAEILEGKIPKPPRMQDGATAVALAPDGTITLRSHPDILRAWLDDESLELWAVDGEGRPHPLKIDRCRALRPNADALPPDARPKLDRECPPPPPPQSPPR